MMLSTIWGVSVIVGSAPGHWKWSGDEELFSDSTEYLLQKKKANIAAESQLLVRLHSYL